MHVAWKSPQQKSNFFPLIFYFPKGVRNRIIFGQWLDTQSDVKLGSNQHKQRWCGLQQSSGVNPVLFKPLMLMSTVLENSVVLGFGVWAWMKHELPLTLGLNHIQINSSSNLEAPQVLWPRCSSAELYSCHTAAGLLKTDSGGLSTEWVFRRIQTIVLLNEEDSPGEPTEQDVSESFRQALRCTSVCPS